MLSNKNLLAAGFLVADAQVIHFDGYLIVWLWCNVGVYNLGILTYSVITT